MTQLVSFVTIVLAITMVLSQQNYVHFKEHVSTSVKDNSYVFLQNIVRSAGRNITQYCDDMFTPVAKYCKLYCPVLTFKQCTIPQIELLQDQVFDHEMFSFFDKCAKETQTNHSHRQTPQQAEDEIPQEGSSMTSDLDNLVDELESELVHDTPERTTHSVANDGRMMLTANQLSQSSQTKTMCSSLRPFSNNKPKGI